MTNFRIDVSRETGGIMLWVEAPCGFRPVLGWSDLDGMKEFTEMLLGFCNSRQEERNRVEEVSEDLLRQALGDE